MGLQLHEQYAEFQQEVFGRLYSRHTRPAKYPASWAEKLHQNITVLPEFESLQAVCRGDEQWAGLTTSILTKHLVAKAPAEPGRNVRKLQRRVDGLEELIKAGVPVDKALARAKTELIAAQENPLSLDETSIRNAARAALAEAAKEIESQQAAIQAMTFGSKPGVPAIMSMEAARAAAARIKGSKTLQKIAALAGKFRCIAAEKQRSKSNYARSEIADVEQGADIARLLPSELVNLANEGEQGLLFFSKLLDQQVLQYRLSGNEREGRGPIVMLLDESGSMDGPRNIAAKATALALLDIARRQHRPFAIIHFDTLVHRVHHIHPDTTPSFESLAEMLEHFTNGGGTDFRPALTEALNLIKAENALKRADIILVTDGEARLGAEEITSFKESKKALEANLYSIAINCKTTSTLASLSDKIWSIAELTQSSVQDVIFSI